MSDDFPSLSIKSTYNSEDDSILKDFYLPALSISKRYDRAVGFFSASMLSYAAQGLSGFVRKDGKMRLIIGHQVEPDEYDAIKKGHKLKDLTSNLDDKLELIIQQAEDGVLQYRLSLLSWLIASERLEVKLAIRSKGMYHEKIGILEDTTGNKIVFQGSANESVRALLPDFNFESISIYPSWKEQIFTEYGVPYENRFERIWKGEVRDTAIIPLPSELYEKIKKIKKDIPPGLDVEVEIYEEALSRTKRDILTVRIPHTLNGKPYELREHQRKALETWRANDFKGIFKLATGAGKTITAIHGAVSLATQLQKGFFIVVAVPYQNLADQWCDILNIFGLYPVECYRSKTQWETELKNKVSDFMINPTGKTISAVVVNKTMATESFSSVINKIPSSNLIFIGDECHHHTSKSFENKLPEARYKIGLSATPWEDDDYESEETLSRYYGPIVAEYGLAEALKDKVLTPYRYYLHEVHLTDDECEQYEKLTSELTMLIAANENAGNKYGDAILHKLLARSRVLGSAVNKESSLLEVIKDTGIHSHTLFYCGDGSVEDEETNLSYRDIEVVSRLLINNGWSISKFTAEESLSERHKILDSFKHGFIDSLVSIRVLDEGIDIPACTHAFLLASSKSKRQYIQRRGRILRQSPGKEYAVIHDFIVLPPKYVKNSIALTNLVDDELNRAYEFIRLALNKDEQDKIALKISDVYGINWKAKYYAEV